MPRYWFQQKMSGYGSTPNTWQGWVFTLVFLALVFGVMFGFDYVIADPHARGWDKLIALVVLAVPFLWIVLRKTEP
jgi:hypothetical protein